MINFEVHHRFENRAGSNIFSMTQYIIIPCIDYFHGLLKLSNEETQ